MLINNEKNGFIDLSEYELSDNQRYIVSMAYYLGYTTIEVKKIIELTKRENLSDDQMYALCLSYYLSPEQLEVVKSKTETDALNGHEVLELLKEIVFEDMKIMDMNCAEEKLRK